MQSGPDYVIYVSVPIFTLVLGTCTHMHTDLRIDFYCVQYRISYVIIQSIIQVHNA